MDTNVDPTRIASGIMMALAAGDGEGREGPLYAAAMATGCTLDDFQGVLGVLVKVGLVTRGASFSVELTAAGRKFLGQAVLEKTP